MDRGVDLGVYGGAAPRWRIAMSWNWRFRRRLRLAPGATLNLGKRGASLSLGIRGAHLTIGRRRPRITLGVPGTGLSMTRTIDNGGRAGHSVHPPAAPRDDAALPSALPTIVAIGTFALVHWHGGSVWAAMSAAFAAGVAVASPRHRVAVFIAILGLFFWLGWLS